MRCFLFLQPWNANFKEKTTKNCKGITTTVTLKRSVWQKVGERKKWNHKSGMFARRKKNKWNVFTRLQAKPKCVGELLAFRKYVL